MPPQATQTPDASEISNSIYQSASPATATSTSSSSATTAPDTGAEDDRGGLAWGNYLYIVVILGIILAVVGFLYHRRRRISRATTLPHSRFQAFHTHHPSQSRDLSAVQANNRVWRNMRAGPFSHHARLGSAATRRSEASSTVGRSRVDLDGEVPPPYVVAEPERTLDRGPSIRDMRDVRPDDGIRDSVDLNDLMRGREGDSINKPPGYAER